MNPSECVLYSGGLKGAEAAFGAAAERYGVEEVNFTFDGHQIERTRGVRTLTHAELRQGDVSLAYVSKLMHRHYPDTEYIKQVLQTIWHQVNNAQEIYVVGKILDDSTVMGGTGWGQSSPSCATSRCSCLIRTVTRGFAGRGRRGRPPPRRSSAIHILPAPGRGICATTARPPSSGCSPTPFHTADSRQIRAGGRQANSPATASQNCVVVALPP